MKLQYLQAQEADIPVIFEQAKALIDAYEDIKAIAYDKVLAWVEHKIRTQIGDYHCVLWNGKKVAYYRLCSDGELDDFYVLPDYRGLGIGSKIFQRCMKESPAPIYLYVFSANLGAIRFYRRFGLETTSIVSKTRLIMSINS